MGIADVVPGFSGGTVALITGIYERLIGAVSHFDRTLIRRLKSGELSEAAKHVDFRFLAALLIGIGCGFVVTLLTIHQLLDQPDTRPFVLSAFLGMVLGSSWMVFQMIRAHQKYTVFFALLTLVGAGIAVSICLVPPSLLQEPPLYYVFLCGMIAICAMILPGISGALILMLLGTYKYFTGIARDLLHFENITAGLMASAVFGAGCVVGLLCFSRLLRFLFQTRPGATLSVLFGLMLGSVVRLWPFRQITEMEVSGVVIENDQATMPAQWGTDELLVLLVAVVAAGVVFGIARMANRNGASI